MKILAKIFILLLVIGSLYAQSYTITNVGTQLTIRPKVINSQNITIVKFLGSGTTYTLHQNPNAPQPPNTFTLNNNKYTLTLDSNTYSQHINITQGSKVTEESMNLYPIFISCTKPSTLDGVITVTGNFLRQIPGEEEQLFITTEDEPGNRLTLNFNTDYKCVNISDNFKLIISNIPENTGTLKVIWGNVDNELFSTPYASAKIGSVSYDGKFMYITGDNFGQNLNDDFAMLFDGVAVDNSKISAFGHKKLTFEHNNIVVRAVNITFNVRGIVDTGYKFTFQPIVKSITSVSNKGGPITISGSFLNTKRSNGDAATVSITIGGNIPCTNPTTPPTNLDNSLLICTLGAGSGDDLPISVVIDGAATSTGVLFSYAIPILKGVEHKPDGTLLVTGESLGTTNSILNINGVLNITQPTVITEFESLSFKIPLDTTNGVVKVIVGKKTSNSKPLELTPIIKTISDSPTEGGTITISGSFLSLDNSQKAQQTISLTDLDNKNFKCSNFKEIPSPSNLGLTCDVIQGIGRDHHLVLQIATKTSSNITFNYQKPVISAIFQNITVANIGGVNFATLASGGTILYDNITISLKSANHSKASFEIPPLSKGGVVSINVGGQISNNYTIVNKPSILSFSSIKTDGGNLTINGAFFFHQEKSDIQVKLGNNICTNATVVDAQLRIIHCQLQPGSGGNHNISITIDKVVLENPNSVTFSYEPPKIISVTQSVGYQGGLITIIGSSLINPLTIQIGNRECTSPNVTQYSIATCFLTEIDRDDLPEGTVPITINVNGLKASAPLFQYIQPGGPTKDELKAKKIKWLVPAIVIPCFIGLVTITIVGVILIKRHRRLKEMQKMFKQ